jgi:hypothetical protein
MLLLKRFLLVLTVALWTHSASAFALLGPRDTWQVNALGYDPQGDNGDIGGPKNLGEEWRWNVPVITYAFDESFINYFGTNGIKAVNEAMFLFNREMGDFEGLTNPALLRKPTRTRRVHETARALGLFDIKSRTMGFLAEQLGLASAERWTWALRSRNQPAGSQFTNYFVVQRNFDPFSSTPTPYVNNTRYSYQIRAFPAARFTSDFEAAATFPVDASSAISGSVSATVGEDFTTIPSLQLHAGEYFEALTRDDIAGLRYIYRSSNVNIEDTIANTFSRVVDTRNLITTNGFDAFTFFSNALLTSPSVLMTQFPGLLVNSNVTATITNIFSTNYFQTNFPTSGLKTNYDLGILITNLDLYVFSEASRTNRADFLRALPGYAALNVTSTNSYFVTELVPVRTFGFPPNGFPGDGPSLYTNYVTNVVVNYNYTYGNVVTNYSSPITDLQVLTVAPPPNGSPNDFILVTNSITFRTNKVSGGFYILDRTTNANLVAHSFVDPNGVPTVRATNIVYGATNNVDLFTNSVGLVQRTDIANVFTNLVYAAWPVTINGVDNAVLTNSISSTQFVRFNYDLSIASLLNINLSLTNYANLNTNFGNLIYLPPVNGSNQLTVQTISFTNGVLSVTSSNIPSPVPMGTVLIIDQNQFQLTTNRVDIFGLVTNTIIAYSNAVTGEFITQSIIYQTNNVIIGVNPVILTAAGGTALRPGINSIRFDPVGYIDFLDQPNTITTNRYTARTLNGTNVLTSVFQRVGGPDIVISAADLGVDSGGFPVGFARNFSIQTAPGAAPVTIAGTLVDGGPGLIVPTSFITFSKIIPFNWNQNPNVLREDEASVFGGWGSFDGSTIVPRVYPEDLTTQAQTLQTLEDIALRRNSP